MRLLMTFRGALIGGATSLVGGIVWWILVGVFGRSPLVYINHCPTTSVSPDCGMMPLLPLIFGPAAATALNVAMSARLDAWLSLRPHTAKQACWWTAGAYLFVLCFLAGLSHLPNGGWAGMVIVPLGISGLDWVGPVSLAVWSILLGFGHAQFGTRFPGLTSP